MFLASTAVMMDELSKFILSFFMLSFLHFRRVQGSHKSEPPEVPDSVEATKGYWAYLRREVITESSLLMAVPALLYTVQKNLLYVALSNLDACVYQVSYSAKIVTTAVFSFLILGKKFPPRQQVALITLMIGVALVQVAQIQEGQKVTGEHPVLGFVSVSAACVTSGFASVYFEYWLKRTIEFWAKQAQLAFFAFLLAGAAVFLQDYKAVAEDGLFQGYDYIVVLTITFEAGGGIIVALVTKYADSIAKNFATALSLTVTTALSAIFWEFQITVSFVLGTVLTLTATYMYQQELPAMAKGTVAKAVLALGVGLLMLLCFTSPQLAPSGVGRLARPPVATVDTT